MKKIPKILIRLKDSHNIWMKSCTNQHQKKLKSFVYRKYKKGKMERTALEQYLKIRLSE